MGFQGRDLGPGNKAMGDLVSEMRSELEWQPTQPDTEAQKAEHSLFTRPLS